MKIIVLGTRGFPNIQGGVEKHCEELYPRLAALGCEVTVLGRSTYTGRKRYRYHGVTILPIPSLRNKFLETFLHSLLAVLKARQLKGDILHVHAIGPSLFVPLARCLGFKVVMTHHGPDYERKKWNALARFFLRLGEKWGVRYAHQVIVISKGIARNIRQKFGREVTVIPNGVVVSQRCDEIGVLKRYRLEVGKYILAVGRFVPEKGFHELLQGFQQFLSLEANRESPWKLTIVGDSDHEDEFSRELKKRSRSIPNVVLTGMLNAKSLRELYSHAGLFVLPSFYEGLPIALLEALSHGSSCLVSDIPANREVGLEEARYFKPGDSELLARKFWEFLDRPEPERQREKWIRHVAENYNWDSIAQKTLEVYERVLRPVDNIVAVSLVKEITPNENSKTFSLGAHAR